MKIGISSFQCIHYRISWVVEFILKDILAVSLARRPHKKLNIEILVRESFWYRTWSFSSRCVYFCDNSSWNSDPEGCAWAPQEAKTSVHIFSPFPSIEVSQVYWDSSRYFGYLFVVILEPLGVIWNENYKLKMKKMGWKSEYPRPH